MGGPRKKREAVFLALIKEFKQLSLETGDKAAYVKLEFIADNYAILDAITRLQRADKYVEVTLKETAKAPLT